MTQANASRLETGQVTFRYAVDDPMDDILGDKYFAAVDEKTLQAGDRIDVRTEYDEHQDGDVPVRIFSLEVIQRLPGICRTALLSPVVVQHLVGTAAKKAEGLPEEYVHENCSLHWNAGYKAHEVIGVMTNKNYGRSEDKEIALLVASGEGALDMEGFSRGL